MSVTVDDVNDNTPVITGPQSTSVLENVIIGTPVIAVQGYDSDIGVNADLTYAIVGGNTRNDLQIDETTGEISTSNLLYRERTDKYLLDISVTDSGTTHPAFTPTVTVTVGDIDDNEPQFGRLFYNTQAPYNKVGLVIATVTAFDSDVGSNADITFSLSADSDTEYFSISPSGRYNAQVPTWVFSLQDIY